MAAIADEVQRQLKDNGRKPLHVEGERRSDWILLDYGDFVIHVFTEERRSFYGLDGLWGDAPRLDASALGIDRAASVKLSRSSRIKPTWAANRIMIARLP